MKISYAITVCSELEEIQRLLTFLLKHKELQDEIVITYDSKNGSIEVEDFLFNYDGNFRLAPFNFLGNLLSSLSLYSLIISYKYLVLVFNVFLCSYKVLLTFG